MNSADISNKGTQTITVHVRFFARLRETLDTDILTLELPSGSTAGDLFEQLADQGGPWAELRDGKPVMIAINQSMARPARTLDDGDEVALFPPVTGG
ncbi:molybdopterin converting factor subunit 1 [Marinobacter sp.]|uniref:molybdopterin converting factor subunit 1 n=1 Tax=Marinobacter sp. TaxID=50741 RepID=UPI00384B700D